MSQVVASSVGGIQIGLFREYRIDGKRWAVPFDFRFPSVTLRAVWGYFLLGFPSNRSKKKDDDGNDVIKKTTI